MSEALGKLADEVASAEVANRNFEAKLANASPSAVPALLRKRPNNLLRMENRIGAKPRMYNQRGIVVA
jgi:hypothetical protein